ncbi:hypothetical protein A0H81_13645 [Grifola frondosa]|uniref:Uncharacterized protein n=1 Tax=Grifola frondosa TaxID=5627 RepID=A0A1C7LQN2_GRIFR|nr:hypothetical protein A0H81_13645 [Grifola frondosa]
MVNSVKAFTLFDSGCTTDLISPKVTYLALANCIDLARPRIVVGPVNTVHYLDVVDIDRYDLILSTMFCNTYGVNLDFETHTICIKGMEVPAYTTMEEVEILANRLETRQLRMAAYLNAATMQLPPTSRGLCRDRFGELDPLGLDNTMTKAFVDLLKDEEIRQTLGKDSEELNARPMDPPTEEETERLSTLRAKWLEECSDIMRPAPEELLPFREINHQILLIDPDKQYRYHLSQCPDAKKPELLEKIARYTNAGWWEPASVSQAASLLCVAKKNGKLCTVVDAQSATTTQ